MARIVRNRGLRWLLTSLLVSFAALQATSILQSRVQPQRDGLTSWDRGDTLPPIVLTRRVAGPSATRRMALTGLVDSGCHVFIFFKSDSPHADRVATRWNNATLAAGNQVLPIIWVADERDTGASEFVATHSLPGPWYTYASSSERQQLRVRGSPSLFLIAPGGVFVEQLTQSRRRLSRIPSGCE